MSTLSEFMARDAPPEKERGKSRVRSTSRGPVVVLKGWRKGMDKGGVTLLLRNNGVALSEAYDATNGILRGDLVTVQLPKGSDMEAIRRQLTDLGVVL
jgi:hypothetical protein